MNFSARLFFLLLLPGLLYAELRLPAIFGTHMVLQQKRPIPVWGWAEAGSEVTVLLGEDKKEVQAGVDGSWRVEFPARTAGGDPLTLTVSADEDTRTFTDILVGEVWLCSGQSNMDWSIAQSADPEKHLAQADLPRLRLFRMARSISHKEDPVGKGAWKISSPESAAGITAVGWHFGREILNTQDVPVGILHSAWGGTFIEAWTPMQTLEEQDFLTDRIAQYRKELEISMTSPERIEKLQQTLKDLKFLQDPGNRGFFFGWHLNELNEAGWKDAEVPSQMEKTHGQIDGAVWYRKSVILPGEWAGQDLLLELGAIDDFDVTYVNGMEVGQTGKETPKFYEHPRSYRIPADLVNADAPLQISIRIFDHFGIGGFRGKAEQMRLRPADKPDAQPLPLAGVWKTRMELSQLELHRGPVAQRLQPGPNKPAVLYNGMIHSLTSFPLQGVLWYQGESNSGRPDEYHVLFPAMIQSWRTLWKDPELEFYYVQLANYKELQSEPSEGNWAWIREAQQSALNLPGTAEAVILDVGDAEDIHPRDKVTPARRLALHARALVYGEDIQHLHPRFEKSSPLEKGALELRFTGTYGELSTRDGEAPRGFAVRAAGEEWVWAEAALVKPDRITLRHPEAKAIADVRYAWAFNPIGNIRNLIGHPLSPFRTDADE